jgi:hypothetical protein
MLHLYSAAVLAVIATNVVMLVLIAVGIKRVAEAGGAILRGKIKNERNSRANPSPEDTETKTIRDRLEIGIPDAWML